MIQILNWYRHSIVIKATVYALAFVGLMFMVAAVHQHLTRASDTPALEVEATIQAPRKTP